ncbi:MULTISPECIES: TetR/AcrR family transcriptional regulator [Neobacillus]|uniref:TetR/AcrR family transcriptional regulator n=1 Tax=Neobacillus TaxID=2675232 RepID=UPI001F18BE72|nr:TetR/AcrR family transcriptional regulator [Neobacillus drentensis]ULT54908.1 TetR/AcrR family transcriptional regulator [Neobacillus drentensis]
MTDQEKPRLDPRILRTRQLIKEALIDLLQEVDINKITVNRIAERATINRVTFYLHYKDIPDMLEIMAQEMAEDIESIMGSNTEDQKDDKNIDFVKLETLLEYIAKNAKFYKVVLNSRRTPIFTERLLTILTKSITEKTGNNRLETSHIIPRDIAIWYGSSALIGTIVAWLRNDMPYTPQFLAKQLSILFRLGKE